MRAAVVTAVLLASAAALAAPRKRATAADSDDADEAAPVINGKRSAKRVTHGKAHAKASVTIDDDADGATASPADDDITIDAPEPVVVEHVSRTRSTNTFYFRAGIAHVDARVTSGGLQLEP